MDAISKRKVITRKDGITNIVCIGDYGNHWGRVNVYYNYNGNPVIELIHDRTGRVALRPVHIDQVVELLQEAAAHIREEMNDA